MSVVKWTIRLIEFSCPPLQQDTVNLANIAVIETLLKLRSYEETDCGMEISSHGQSRKTNLKRAANEPDGGQREPKRAANKSE